MRTITRALTVLSFTIACAVLAAAQAANVTGTWTFTVETSQGGGSPVITFNQDGEKLTGHYSSQTLGEADFTGTVKGTAIQFTFTANAQGTEIDVAYTGTVDGNTMKGTVAMAGGQLSGTFTGKKK
jgi:hypothetical protein